MAKYLTIHTSTFVGTTLKILVQFHKRHLENLLPAFYQLFTGTDDLLLAFLFYNLSLNYLYFYFILFFSSFYISSKIYPLGKVELTTKNLPGSDLIKKEILYRILQALTLPIRPPSHNLTAQP